MSTIRVHTIGHSTHEIVEFINILQTHGIKQLVDIRTIPRSRHNPQYNEEVLGPSLLESGISYHRAKDLGGLRHTHKDSINGAWRNDSFRGYADYMQTKDFELALEGLIARAGAGNVVIMCAEAVPWRCHRSLIGDALLVRGVEVLDIMGLSAPAKHTLTSFAVVSGTTITYPPEDSVPDPEEPTGR